MQVFTGPSSRWRRRRAKWGGVTISAQPPSLVSRPQFDELRAVLQDGSHVAVVPWRVIARVAVVQYGRDSGATRGRV